MHKIFSIKTVVCISYKNIFIKTLLIVTLNGNIKTCLQKEPKKITKNIRARKWTSAEVTQFAKVLVDKEYKFEAALEELARKKETNNEVFTLIQKIFDQKGRQNNFMEVNEAENFTNPNGVVSEYTPLDTSLEKLRRKYTTTKTEWRKMSDRCKTGSGLAPEKNQAGIKY